MTAPATRRPAQLRAPRAGRQVVPPIPRRASLTLLRGPDRQRVPVAAAVHGHDGLPGPAASGRSRARRSIRPRPDTGTYQGETYPIYSVPIDGTMTEPDPRQEGPDESTFVDPGDRDAGADRLAGPLADAPAGWTFAPTCGASNGSGRSSISRGSCSTPAAVATLSTIGGGPVVGARRVRLRPLPVPRPEHPVRRPDRDDHPAVPGDPHPDLRRLHVARLERDLAAADHPPLLRERLQRVPAAPVLPVDPARPRRGRDDRRRRARSGSCGR